MKEDIGLKRQPPKFLSLAGIKIWWSTLPRLKDPDDALLDRLDVYAWCAAEFKAAALAGDDRRSGLLRRAMVYARNGLGIAQAEPVDLMELLLDCGHEEDDVISLLKPEWEIRVPGSILSAALLDQE